MSSLLLALLLLLGALVADFFHLLDVDQGPPLPAGVHLREGRLQEDAGNLHAHLAGFVGELDLVVDAVRREDHAVQVRFFPVRRMFWAVLELLRHSRSIA